MISEQVSIIIPGSNFTDEFKKTVSILKQSKIAYEIIFITNLDLKTFSENVKVVKTNLKNISQKRNFGVNQSSGNYIAFIDSDAYPSINWLENGIKILKDNTSIGLVTGPDVVDKNINFLKFIIGNAHKSFIFSGKNYFRKYKNTSSEVLNAFSCNMIMKKKIYLDINGMNEALYIAEDLEFSKRINKLKKIFFSKDVLVYHTPRDFIPFLFQRFSYGYEIINAFKNLDFFSKISYLMPLIILILFIISLIFKFNILISIPLFFMISCFLFESVRITHKNYYFLFYFFILVLGTIAFGAGTLFKLLKINLNIKKIYTFRNYI